MAVSTLKSTARVDSTKIDYGLSEGDFDVRFKGATFGTYERNGYDDSDFYAVVWDDEAECLRAIEYATTRGWTYANGATIDATDEVKDKAREWLIKRDTEHAITQAATEACLPDRGKRIRITKGRKIAKGTEGEIFWIGEDRYSRHGDLRIGFKTDDGEKHFTAEANATVIEPGQHIGNTSEIAERIRARVEGIGKGYVSGTLTSFSDLEGDRRAKAEASAFVSAYRSYGGALNLSGAFRAFKRKDQINELVEQLSAVTA